MKYFNIILLLLVISLLNLKVIVKEKKYNYVLDTSYISNIDIEIKKEVFVSAIKTYTGEVTAYEPNCSGCIGITASGYDVRDTIYYDDLEYGRVRIVAADSSLPFGTIVKLSNLSNSNNLIAIVLDRGGAIGFNKGAAIDLLFNDEESSLNFGRNYNVSIDILRFGY